VDWTDVRFVDETEWGRVSQTAFDNPALSDANENTSGQPEKVFTHANILFQTKFSNNTNDEQEYTMKTEKTTSSSCSTSIETGFTKGYEMSVTLKTPCEVLEANAGYRNEMSLTRSEGQSIEETLTWGVESQIRVKRGHVAEAQLVVNEQKRNGDFTVVSRISGTVLVRFTNIRNNNQAFRFISNSIYGILEKYADMERRKGHALDFVNFDQENDTVVVHTKGTCRFKYGVKQEVKVDQKQL
jgi:hypothetical protein